jgi:hypothetical protein
MTTVKIDDFDNAISRLSAASALVSCISTSFIEQEGGGVVCQSASVLGEAIFAIGILLKDVEAELTKH